MEEPVLLLQSQASSSCIATDLPEELYREIFAFIDITVTSTDLISFLNTTQQFYQLKKNHAYYTLNRRYSRLYLQSKSSVRSRMLSLVADPFKQVCIILGEDKQPHGKTIGAGAFGLVKAHTVRVTSLFKDWQLFALSGKVANLELLHASHFSDVKPSGLGQKPLIFNRFILRNDGRYTASGSFDNLDLALFTQVKEVDLSWTTDSSFIPYHERSIRRFFCSIPTALNKSHLGKLQVLNLSNRQFQIDCSLLATLNEVNLSHCNNLINISSLANVKKAILSCSTSVSNSDVKGLAKGGNDELSFAGCAQLTNFSFLDSVRTLDISGTKINSTLALARFDRLEQLTVSLEDCPQATVMDVLRVLSYVAPQLLKLSVAKTTVKLLSINTADYVPIPFPRLKRLDLSESDFLGIYLLVLPSSPCFVNQQQQQNYFPELKSLRLHYSMLAVDDSLSHFFATEKARSAQPKYAMDDIDGDFEDTSSTAVDEKQSDLVDVLSNHLGRVLRGLISLDISQSPGLQFYLDLLVRPGQAPAALRSLVCNDTIREKIDGLPDLELSNIRLSGEEERERPPWTV